MLEVAVDPSDSDKSAGRRLLEADGLAKLLERGGAIADKGY